MISSRLTIITSTLNCASYLKQTAMSIREQNLTDFQWIIADGGSSDETVKVIKDNIDIVSYWFSEFDTGIYDAWNKAINFIDGEWTLFLGAGDTLYSSDTLDICRTELKYVKEDYDFAFGNIKIHGKDKCYEIAHKGKFNPILMDLNYSTPPHSSTFTRSLLLKNNRFDTRFKIIGDRKFMLLHSHGKYYNLEKNVTVMNGFGISNQVRNIPLIWNENILIFKDREIASISHIPMVHVIKAFIANYRNIILLKMVGEYNYAKWFTK